MLSMHGVELEFRAPNSSSVTCDWNGRPFWPPFTTDWKPDRSNELWRAVKSAINYNIGSASTCSKSAGLF